MSKEYVPGKWGVSWTPEEGFTLLTPELKDNGQRHIPEAAQALTAFVIRCQSEFGYQKEMSDWLEHMARSTKDGDNIGHA